jgi:hypothetical protein
MLFRVVIVLLCVVAFINGCNSLISRVAGTHKLRTYTMNQVLKSGVGDADYIKVDESWRVGDFVHTPPLKRGYKPVVAYPVLSKAQIDSLGEGLVVHPAIIAWAQKFDAACVNAGNCAPAGSFTLEGITRPIDKERNRSNTLSTRRFSIPENVIYIETGRKPLDWYWNLLIMVLALGVGGGMELYHSYKAKKQVNNA